MNTLQQIDYRVTRFYLTLAGRYAAGLMRHRSLRLIELNTQMVASSKLAYTSWLSHENVAWDIGAEDSRGTHCDQNYIVIK